MKADMRWRKILMLMTVLTLGIIAFSCDDDDDSANKKNYTISGNASGSQMVPAVTGTGTGTIAGTYNPNNRILDYTNTWSGLSGPPTGGGFYNGTSGTNGVSIGSPWTFDATATTTGSHTGSIKLTPAQEEQLLDGDWYYVYNTAVNSTGEIRGQMSATQEQ